MNHLHLYIFITLSFDTFNTLKAHGKKGLFSNAVNIEGYDGQRIWDCNRHGRKRTWSN